MLPAIVVFSPESLFSAAGGFAAAIAIGAFVGQAIDTLQPVSDLRRRRLIAVGGFIDLVLMSGLILLSASRW